MKTYKLYEPGTEVYAISEYYKDGKATDYVAIFPATIGDIWIHDKIEYQLQTPAGDDWGDVVNANNVHEDFNILVNRMRKHWERNANML